ncbi:MAG: hypothetical protein AB2535_19255 [Candidatus Thiodiazotropha endolucinida]
MNTRTFSITFCLLSSLAINPLYSADESGTTSSYMYHEIDDPDGSTTIIEYAPNDLPADIGSNDILSKDSYDQNLTVDSNNTNADQKRLFSQDELGFGISALVNPWRKTITCRGENFATCASYAGSLDVRIPTWNWTNFELVFPRDGSNTLNYTDTSNSLTGVLNLELIYGEHRVLDTCTPMGLGCQFASLYSDVTVRATNQAGIFVARAKFKRIHRFVGDTPNEQSICITTKDQSAPRRRDWICEYKRY